MWINQSQLRLLACQTCMGVFLIHGSFFPLPCQAQTLPVESAGYSEIANLLEIPAATEAMPDLDELKQAITGGDKAAIDAAAKKLAQQMTAAQEPAAALARRFDDVKIPAYASYAQADDPAFARSVERHRIAMLLLQRAKAETNPADAGLYVKAALLLGVTDDSIFARSLLLEFDAEFADYVKLAGFTPEQSRHLQALIGRNQDQYAAFSAALSPALYGRDLLLDTKENEAFDADLADAVLVYFDAAWKRTAARRDLRFITIQELWTLRNLAVRHQDAALKTRIDQLLDRWAGDAGKDEVIARWLIEAAQENAQAAIPKHFVGFTPDHPAITKLQQRLKDYKAIQP